MCVASDSRGEGGQRGGWQTGGWVRGDDAEAGEVEEHHLSPPWLFIGCGFDAEGR